MPFAEYDDFDACVRENSDKGDPEAYCAAIKREVEGSDGLNDEEREAAERDDCEEGHVNVGGRCIPINEVENVPPSSLDMSNHRILANRTLAGPIKRVEMDDGTVKYEDVALLDSGVWTDAGSGEPTEYDPAELEVAEENSVNIMHDSESDASEAGHIDAESYHVEDGTGYADVVLDTSKSAGEYADENLQETLESNGKVGFGGPSIEIPAKGYDLEREGEGYPKLVNGTIEGLGFVRDPASKSTSFAHQTAQRGVAMSAAEDSPTLTVYTREDVRMSEEIRNAVLARELQVDEIQDDAQAIADELDVPVGEVMEVLDPLLDMEEDDEPEDEPPEEEGDVENESDEDDDEPDEEDKENEGDDLAEEVQALWDELEALKDGMMAEEDAQDLADAEEVEALREEKQALADANEELEKRLEALEDEPTKPKSMADSDADDDWEPQYDPTPSPADGW